MSEHFNEVNEFYHDGRWTIERVRKAVEKGWITPEEFKIITGENY